MCIRYIFCYFIIIISSPSSFFPFFFAFFLLSLLSSFSWDVLPPEDIPRLKFKVRVFLFLYKNYRKRKLNLTSFSCLHWIVVVFWLERHCIFNRCFLDGNLLYFSMTKIVDNTMKIQAVFSKETDCILLGQNFWEYNKNPGCILEVFSWHAMSMLF